MLLAFFIYLRISIYGVLFFGYCIIHDIFHVLYVLFSNKVEMVSIPKYKSKLNFDIEHS